MKKSIFFSHSHRFTWYTNLVGSSKSACWSTSEWSNTKKGEFPLVLLFPLRSYPIFLPYTRDCPHHLLSIKRERRSVVIERPVAASVPVFLWASVVWPLATIRLVQKKNVGRSVGSWCRPWTSHNQANKRRLVRLNHFSFLLSSVSRLNTFFCLNGSDNASKKKRWTLPSNVHTHTHTMELESGQLQLVVLHLTSWHYLVETLSLWSPWTLLLLLRSASFNLDGGSWFLFCFFGDKGQTN